VITDYHAKYYAHELTLQHSADGVDRLSQSLFDASVDLNPHQIEAALFALANPLNKGVILADEVGLGKTIEAGLVLSQYWAERKRQLIIICPASLRRQWAAELQEKFNLPCQILDAPTVKKQKKAGIYNPLSQKKVIIMSYHYAARLEEELLAIPWSLVVIDEAHKLRNSHRPKNKMGQALKRALDGRQKLLLTATPLQNSLIELYGLSTVIDEHLFGDDKAFRKQYMTSAGDLPELRERLDTFVHRTLRKQVLEYVPYTERKTITQPFTPTDEEHALYEAISTFLLKEGSFALPRRQKHLTSLIIRKLLASSSHAVVNTLKAIKTRLELLKGDKLTNDNFLEQLIEDDGLEDDYLDDGLLEGDGLDEEAFSFLSDENQEKKDVKENLQKINNEIEELTTFIEQANQIKVYTKAKSLLKSIDVGFQKMKQIGAPRKMIIFTESRRTQEYLDKFLSANGYQDKLVTFSGTNSTPKIKEIYENWKHKHQGSDALTGSAQIDKRSAIIDYFKSDAEIMIATEAAAEGVNLQFCSLLINYDLPWNPQRVEQRIGRCHRYGQKHDVVVINFLNKRNQADRRVLELLTEKFNLFDGVFGASDDVLGRIENGIDFEKRILTIYETCRQPKEIERAFEELQKELESNINEKMEETQKLLIENFDENIHDLLRVQLAEAEKRLDKIARIFWALTKHQLVELAEFDDEKYQFSLNAKPSLSSHQVECPKGRYELIQKGVEPASNHHILRMNHALGEFIIDSAKLIDCDSEDRTVVFNVSQNTTKLSIVEQFKGQSGLLVLNKLSIHSFQEVEHLIFTALSEKGSLVDQEACEQLFQCMADIKEGGTGNIREELEGKLEETQQRQIEARISLVLEANNEHFQVERDRLEKWADDKVTGAEQTLLDTKAKIKALKRESRQSPSLDDQKIFQEKIKQEEHKQRKQRQQIFDVEDEILEKRDELIEALEKRLNQKTTTENLFTIGWKVV
jgi:SNF2 family DNA or RNA helicase